MLITVSNVTVSEDEYAAIGAEQWLSRNKNRWPLLVFGLAALVFLVLIVRSLWARTENPYEPWPMFKLVWLGFVVFYVFWWRRYRLQRFYRKQYRSSTASQVPCTFRFTETEIESVSELAQSTIRYTALTKSVTRGHWLLLYFSDSGYTFVDLNRVQAPATPDDLLQLLRLHNIKVE